MSYLSRYLAGEYEPVWDELMALGASVREEPVYSDALAVARETMRRVRRNIEMLIPRLEAEGYEFGYGWAITRGVLSLDEATEMAQHDPTFSDPPPNVTRLIEDIEQRVGVLPVSLRAFYEEVGGVNLVGASPDWQFHRFDPLHVLSAQEVIDLDEWNRWSEDKQPDGSCDLPIAPDEYFKYLYSGGGPYCVLLPTALADAPLRHEWHHTTFVKYLRICLRWGGLPGAERVQSPPIADFARLTEGLPPI